MNRNRFYSERDFGNLQKTCMGSSAGMTSKKACYRIDCDEEFATVWFEFVTVLNSTHEFFKKLCFFADGYIYGCPVTHNYIAATAFHIFLYK